MRHVLNDFEIILPASLCLNEQQGDLSNDSRTLKPDDIFCAVIGHAQDGRKYIAKAVSQGASLILSECETKLEHGKITYLSHAGQPVAVINVYQLNKQLFELASSYYQAPQTQMTMIGITGTNGKTSTSQLLGQILTRCQKSCAIIGTNGTGVVDVNNEHYLTELANTTPSATDLVQLFHAYAQQKVTYLAMEVSSHALAQQRVSENVFDIAVFTNLSRDHLDYHGSMAGYAAAKRRLFTNSSKQVAIVNGDDEQAQIWLANWSSPQKLWVYGRSEQVKNKQYFVSCQHVKHHSQGVEFTLTSHLGDIKIRSPLLGDFNIDNLLAVISVLLVEGIPLFVIAQQVEKIKPIAGRMETFTSNSDSKKLATTVVDYAHTPDALEKALIACRQHCRGKLYVVFGCGGDRDKGKRPLMAKAAEKYADQLVITSDNPRTEAPLSIIDDIVAGLAAETQATIIENRQQAVEQTLAKAQVNDVVLLAGKGHEDYIIIGSEKINYNERQVVMEFYAHWQMNQMDEPA